MYWDVKYHPAVARSVSVGNVIFVSGCTGQDTGAGKPTPIEGQVRMALDKARAAVETAGSSMDNIVKTFFFARSLDDYPQVRKTEVEYYLEHAPHLVEHPPAATFIVVTSLAQPDFLIEYEAIGAVDRAAPDWGVKYYPEYWGGRKLAYPHVPKEHAKFARTEVVGNLVIVSGCQALDHGSVKVETSDFKKQTRIVLEKMKRGMEETGGSMNNLVKTNVLLDDLGNLPLYREVEQAYFREHAPDLARNPPASTVIVAESLPRPEFLVEVEAFGVVDKTAPNWTTNYMPGSPYASAGVSVGNLLFLSACDGSNPETGEIETNDVERQIIVALDKVTAAMASAGSSMDKVVKTVLMLRRLEDYPKMRKTELAYYRKHAPRLAANPPASTFIQLPIITGPEALFQIDVTAVL